MGDLKIVLGFAGGMGTNEESVSFVVFVRYTARVNALEDQKGGAVAKLGTLRLLIWQPLR